jgi:hypothetical protein
MPLPIATLRTQVQVNLGQYLIASPDAANGYLPPAQQVSTDGGKSWAAFTGTVIAEVGYAAEGHVTYIDAGFAVHTYDFATAASSVPVRATSGTLMAVGKDQLVSADLQGTDSTDDPMIVALYSQGLATGEVHQLNLRTDFKETDLSDGVGTDVVVAARLEGEDSAVDVVPLDGSPAYPRLLVPGLVKAAVRGQQAVYVAGGDAGTHLCVRSFAGRVWGNESCVPISGPDESWGPVRPELRVGPDWVVVTYRSGTGDWFEHPKEYREQVVWGTDTLQAAVSATAPGNQRTRVVGRGGAAYPLVQVGTATDGYVGRVERDGLVTRAFDNLAPSEPFPVWSMAGAPDRVTVLQKSLDSVSPGRPAWSSPVTPAGLGPARTLTDLNGETGTSGARTVVTLVSEGGQLFDRGAPVRALAGTGGWKVNARTLSGPYYIATSDTGREVRTVDDTRASTLKAELLFGSLALSGGPYGPFRVTDVTDPKRSWTFTLPSHSPNAWQFIGIWGDWILIEQIGSADGAFHTEVLNYRTGEVRICPEQLLPTYIGDGFVLSREPTSTWVQDYRLRLWDFTDDSLHILAEGVYADASDGSHWVAHATGKDLVVDQLTGLGRSGPRMLGVLAHARTRRGVPWAFELDATKALDAGTLVISRGTTTVRELTFEASADGSLRLSWDGKDASGAVVPTGAYAWTVKTTAADGTGALVRVDGSPGVGGSLVVS